MRTFKEFIDKRIEVGDEEWQALVQILGIRQYKAGDVISFNHDI